MRLILKILVLPLFAILAIFVGFITFLLLVSGTILGVLSIIVAILGVAIVFLVDVWGGIAFLFIAFLISPYGLPKLAAYLVGALTFAKESLQDFITT